MDILILANEDSQNFSFKSDQDNDYIATCSSSYLASNISKMVTLLGGKGRTIFDTNPYH